MVEEEERVFERRKCSRNVKRSNERVKERRGFEGFNVNKEAQAATSLSH